MICQLYPSSSPSFLLQRFFAVFTKWDYPAPVMLNEIVTHDHLDLKVWNKFDNFHHIFPILTPAYPSMNSSVNVSTNTLEVLKREIETSNETIKDIFPLILELHNNNNPSKGDEQEEQQIHPDGVSLWGELFKPTDFFIRYSHYIAIHLFTKNRNSNLSTSWIGFVESRLRKLAESLFSMAGIEFVHFLPIKFPTQLENTDHSVCFFIAIKISQDRLREMIEKKRPSTQDQDKNEFSKTSFQDMTLELDGALFNFQSTSLAQFSIPDEYLEEQMRRRHEQQDDHNQFGGEETMMIEDEVGMIFEHLTWSKLPKYVFDGCGGRKGAKAMRKHQRSVDGPQDDEEEEEKEESKFGLRKERLFDSQNQEGMQSIDAIDSIFNEEMKYSRPTKKIRLIPVSENRSRWSMQSNRINFEIPSNIVLKLKN